MNKIALLIVETLGRVITGARLELLNSIRLKKPKSIQELARAVGRDFEGRTRVSSTSVSFGAQEEQVGELFSDLNDDLIRSEAFAILVVEFEAFPEPKILNTRELRALLKKYGGGVLTAEVIGASEAFVRQNAKTREPSS